MTSSRLSRPSNVVSHAVESNLVALAGKEKLSPCLPARYAVRVQDAHRVIYEVDFMARRGVWSGRETPCCVLYLEFFFSDCTTKVIDRCVNLVEQRAVAHG